MGLRTPLYDWHASNGARIVDFAGWDMPVFYRSIIEEHRATRNSVGLFDVSHMGRLWFRGPDAEKLLDLLVTNRVDNLRPGQVRYSLLLNESGGTLDDVLLYRLPSGLAMVVNASNREKILAWIARWSAGLDVAIEDRTAELAMVACQGPEALATVASAIEYPVETLSYYMAIETVCRGLPAVVSRTGYTGEDGIEVMLPNQGVVDLWMSWVAAGATPVGLGARDTLRLEAGMPLYGHELDETIDPIQAGLGWAVKPRSPGFVGMEALKNLPLNRLVRVGLELSDRRSARDGFLILKEIEGEFRQVGRVTSGSVTPTLDRSIAMGYVDPAYSAVGTELAVEIRDRRVVAKVVALPFYQRKRSSNG